MIGAGLVAAAARLKLRQFEFVRHFDFGAARLRAELEAHPELWGQHAQRKAMQPHREMTDIWVRYNAIENLGPRFNDEHESVWYPAWYKLPALRGIVFDLMREVEGERLGGVLITRIPAGSGIARHRDGGWHVEHYDKFYVSVKSQPGAKFICHLQEGDEVLEPEVGECWRFDNRLEHSVRNESAEDRITLIVCIRTEKYRDVRAP